MSAPEPESREVALLPSASGAHSNGANSSSWCGSLRRRNLTIKVAATPSFFGSPTPRLITYNPMKVPYLEAALPGVHRGWQTDRLLWAQSTICCVVALSIGFCTPVESQSVHTEQLDMITTVASAISTLVAFLLGRFVSHVVGAWKGRRANYSRLNNCLRRLLVDVSSCVSVSPGSQTADAELIQVSRATIGRHVLLAGELAVLKARGHMDSERGHAHLKGLGLVEAGEWEAMIAENRHTSVLCWIQAVCVELKRRGHLDGSELQVLCEAVAAARLQANDLMGLVSSDLPMPYANLVGWLVRLALLLQTIVLGFMMRGTDDASCKVYAAIGTFLYAYFFLAFLSMHRTLHNPFLDRLIDVGHEPIANEGLRKLADGLMRGTSFLPPNWPLPTRFVAASAAEP